MWNLVKLVILALSLLVLSANALNTSFVITGAVQMVNPDETGLCEVEKAATQQDCASLCFNKPWCIHFVYDPCCTAEANECRCVMCYLKPNLVENTGSAQVWGEVQTTEHTKMRIQDDCDQSDVSMSWMSIPTECLQAMDDIVTTFSPCQVKSFKLANVVREGSGGNGAYYLDPVCPPSFTPRGQVRCDSEGGVWTQQETIACFPTSCKQFIGQKQYYAGTMNVTSEGYPCHYWNIDGEEFVNFYMAMVYSFDHYNVDEAMNYCRSFLDDDYNQIWCYNANYPSTSVLYDVCNIKTCPDLY